MKRFRFPLRPLVVIRTHRELGARQVLSAALSARAQAEAAVEAARTRAEQAATAVAAARRASSRAGEQSLFTLWHRRECALAAEAEGKLSAAQTEVTRRRQECIEAQRQLKVVTQLEDRARAAHRSACLAQEQREIDEAAGLRAGRQKIWS